MESTQQKPNAHHPRRPRGGESVGGPAAVDRRDRPADRSLLTGLATALVAGGVFLQACGGPAEKPPAGATTASPAPVAAGQPPAVLFKDITAEAGIGFVHFNGARGEKLLPETMGGGGGFFDLDHDARPDLVLVGGSTWPGDPAQPHPPTVSLYRNLGGGRFADVSATHGPQVDFYGMGVAVGDYDGDGWDDLFVTGVGGNHLFRNAEGKLVDVTAKTGVGGDPAGWSTSAAFLDHDRDGDLDLFVCNYVKWSKEIDHQLGYQLTGVGRAYGPPLNYEGTHSTLWRNDGDGTFTDVSKEAGIQVANPATQVPVGKALGVAPIDADGDGWIDLMIANDTVRKFLFHNQGDGTFEETAEPWGLAYDRDGNATGAMGIDAAHYRNDPNVGFAVGNFANEMSSLYVSQGDPTLYADEAITEGIGAPSRTALKFGTLFLDYDLDGRLDLLTNNGHLEEAIDRVDPSQSYRQVPQLFWNAGPEADRTFAQVAAASSGDLSRPLVGRGSAYADIDGDGDLDVLLLQVAGKPLLLRNEQALGHHWLRVRLQGNKANRDAIGAWVELTAGGVTQRRQVNPSKSYLSQSELPVTFGLGTATAVDSLSITWPDGVKDTMTVPGIDREIAIDRATLFGRP